MLNNFQNPLLISVHKNMQEKLLNAFPELTNIPHKNFLSLYPYVSKIPHCFFSQNSFARYLNWLNECDKKYRTELLLYLSENGSRLNDAIHQMRQINSLSWHDTYIEWDDIEMLRYIDQDINPTYLKITEAVFAQLLHVVAFFSRIQRNASTEKLDTYNIVEEIIQNVADSTYLLDGYNTLMRNGIAHGGITYIGKSVHYKDKKGNKIEIEFREVLTKFDALIDCCNGITSALKIFLLKQPTNSYQILDQFIFEEIIESTQMPWWMVNGCLESYNVNNRKQLNIYAQANTLDYRIVEYCMFQSGAIAGFFLPSYDRCFIQVKSKHTLLCHLAFDGKKLHQVLAMSGATLNDTANAIEKDGYIHIARKKLPKFILTILLMCKSGKLHWPLFLEHLRKQFGKLKVTVRICESHRTSWGKDLNGKVYVEGEGFDIDKNVIRSNLSRIINFSLKQSYKVSSRKKFLRFIPLRHVLISIFRVNHRKRTLGGYGLGPDLICTIRIARDKRIRITDISGATVEKYGKYRIAWNKAWLEVTEKSTGNS